MNSIHKKLSTFILGAVLALGVGVGVSGVKAVGAKAEDLTATFDLTVKTQIQDGYSSSKLVFVCGNQTLTIEQNGGTSVINYCPVSSDVRTETRAYKKNIITLDAGLGNVVKKAVFSYGTSSASISGKWTNASYSSGTATATADSQTISVTLSATAKMKSIVLTYAQSTEPSISITNAPASNLEIGNEGTLVASTINATSPVITWSSSDSSVVEIDASTGKYSAKAGGTATITANLTCTEGSAKDEIIVPVNFGELTIDEAYTITSKLEGNTATKYKVIVKGTISSKYSKADNRGQTTYSLYFNTTDGNEFQVFYGYVTPIADFDNWVIGGTYSAKGYLYHYVDKNDNSKMEMTSPEFISYSLDAEGFGTYFLSTTKSACSNPTKDNSTALTAIWDEISKVFATLSDEEQGKVKSATAKESGGTDLEEAVARYDHIVGRYSLKDFIGRVSTSGSNYQDRANSNNAFVLVLISIISVMALAGTASLVVIKKRKSR